ncbi:hypothetical protein Tco_0824314 [Tanacetum coccineum]|uniref:Uncharacterized protein n=1 Tax=Tanacetum coccineum TaxID=301880 RepID=A0ABQ5AKE5_9ASTR
MASFDYRLNPLYAIKECSSCGALYTTDYCCSKGGLVDKIIHSPLCNNPTPLEAFKEHSEIVVNFNDDSTSSDDDSPYGEDIDYVDASPLDVEIVSLEEVEIVVPEVGEIEDDVLCEKLSKINLLIAEIRSNVNFNPHIHLPNL